MNTEESISNLKRFNNNYVRSEILKEINNKIWEYKEFSQWPASVGKHHGYEGGLVIHTEEVWNYALNTASQFNADLDVLFAAVLWHDLAKIWDYQKELVGVFGLADKEMGSYVLSPTEDVIWTKSKYHSLIHHITGSIAEFTRHALNLGLDRSTLEKIQHCMAGHHGIIEYRSPVTPKSIEAVILHYSDMLSATHGKTK